jgi:hypothetical protein
MANKKTVKIADLAQLGRTVDISEDQQILVRALNLREMVGLFIESRDVFLPLYAAGISGDTSIETLGPFLLSAPDMVAKIIAMASDDLESAPLVEQRMPATVQLIALSEIWQASVPDQKKASQLLSEVTKVLQKLSEKSEQLPQQTPSPTILQPV